MDIVLCNPFLDQFGGGERVILEIAKKFNPIIYTMNYEEKKTYPEFAEFEIRKIKPHLSEFPFNMVASLDKKDQRFELVVSAGMRFLNTKIADDYDLINAHLLPSNWIRAKNERVCWYCHGPTLSFEPSVLMKKAIDQGVPPHGKILRKCGMVAYRAIEFPLMKKVEKICTCSDYTKERIGNFLGRQDAEVIYPAVDYKYFNCQSFSHYFLIVSRIIPEKGIDFAIDAFKKFNKDKKWKLVIAGYLYENTRNKEYLEHLKKMCKSHDVHFEINPSDEHMQGIYANCYAKLFSSVEEEWGLVVLEAMASSKPVISINIGGPTISILDGKTGFLVNTIDEMAEKMKFLAERPEIVEKMGKAGRKRVEQNYTWKIFLDKMEKAFKETARAKTDS